MFMRRLITTLNLILACPLLAAMVASAGGEDTFTAAKPAKDNRQASCHRGRILLRRLGGKQRPLARRPGVDQAPSAHAPHQADDRGVRRPRAGLGLARRQAGDHGAADRLGRRPWDRLLRLLLVLEQRSEEARRRSEAHRPEPIPEGQEQPPPEVLPAGGQPPGIPHSRARTSGERPPKAGCRTSSTRSTSRWTASRW